MHFHYGILSTVGIQHFLLFYCDLVSCTTPACFSTFYQCAMVPTLVVEKTILLEYFYNNVYVLLEYLTEVLCINEQASIIQTF